MLGVENYVSDKITFDGREASKNLPPIDFTRVTSQKLMAHPI